LIADPTASHASKRPGGGGRAGDGGARRRAAAGSPALAEHRLPATKSRGENTYA
jgi:hypothetical protein